MLMQYVVGDVRGGSVESLSKDTSSKAIRWVNTYTNQHFSYIYTIVMHCTLHPRHQHKRQEPGAIWLVNPLFAWRQGYGPYLALYCIPF